MKCGKCPLYSWWNNENDLCFEFEPNGYVVTNDEIKRLLTWLSKFCRHIDNGDKWLSDKENLDFFKQKIKEQFGWEINV